VEIARRSRRLYAEREAVIDGCDGALRLSYGEFFDRCDRWSAVLQDLDVVIGPSSLRGRRAGISPQ
jgi:fatty-acyl-CoA synthase